MLDRLPKVPPMVVNKHPVLREVLPDIRAAPVVELAVDHAGNVLAGAIEQNIQARIPRYPLPSSATWSDASFSTNSPSS